jgi:tRNA 2-thiouridine synthesizing protein D
MEFVLIVQTAPGGGQSPHTALAFARAALASGHAIRQVFFLGEGVRALSPDRPPADQPGLNEGWAELARHAQMELLACISAAERRGLGAANAVVHAGSLGQMMTALDGARVVRFCG